MKKHIKYLLFLTVLIPIFIQSGDAFPNQNYENRSDSEVSGKSHLSIRPVFHSGSPELVSGFRYDRESLREDGWNGMFQFAIFGGKSRSSSEQTRYFLPFGKETIVVGEQSEQPLSTSTNFPDILASNLGIYTIGQNFKHSFTINPRQSVVGGAINWRQAFCQNEDKGRGFWIDLLIPIARVNNTLGFKEIIINKDNDDTVDPAATTGLGRPAYGSIAAAMTQSAFNYGKFCLSNDDDCCAGSMTSTTTTTTNNSCEKECHTSKTGVSDIEFKIGYEWLMYEPCHLESYIGFIIPTSNEDDAEYVWKPVVGYGKHWGISWGTSMGVHLWDNEEKEQTLRVEMTSHSQYLFRRSEKRSLDLKYKPWSRYMQLYKDYAQAETAATTQNGFTFEPGINILTREVDVTPGFSLDMNTGAVFEWKRWQGELGYNFLGQREERLKLKEKFCNGMNPAIKAINGGGLTDPKRDITGDIYLNQSVITSIYSPKTGQYTIIPAPVDPIVDPSGPGKGTGSNSYISSQITENDLDLGSASTPCLLAHTVYGSVGYRWDDKEFPMALDFGGSFLFSKSTNATVDRWLLWGKFVLSI